MKKSILYIIALVMALFCSCDRKADFKSESFATFEATSYSVGEDQTTNLLIPVTIYNPVNEEVQIIVRTNTDAYDNDKAAVSGTNYELVYPSSGVLVFEPGEATKNIEVKIIHDNAQTGSKYFDVTIEGADEYFHTGNINKTSCKIRDYEHPLRHFIGDWTGEVYDSMTETMTVLNMTIAEDENDEKYSKLRIYNIDPVSETLDKAFAVKGVANAERTAITLANEQPVGYDETYGYFSLYSFKLTADGVYLGDPMSLQFTTKDGKEYLVLDATYGTIADGYIMSLYEGPAMLTKK